MTIRHQKSLIFMLITNELINGQIYLVNLINYELHYIGKEIQIMNSQLQDGGP